MSNERYEKTENGWVKKREETGEPKTNAGLLKEFRSSLDRLAQARQRHQDAARQVQALVPAVQEALSDVEDATKDPDEMTVDEKLDTLQPDKELIRQLRSQVENMAKD